jgi:hypothetical protein
MKPNLKLRKAKTKSKHAAKISILAAIPFQTLRSNRRAINAVISNLILIAAALVVGFVVLAWSQYQSANYQTQYSNDVNSNIAQIQEKVVFEYVVHVGSELRVYLMNCGIQNVTIHDVYINTNQHLTSVTLVQFGGTPTADNTLHVDEQAYFSVPVADSTSYVVKIVTGRGSTFVGSS